MHFLANKGTYSAEHALVFHDIDYLEISVRLLLHHYDHLARCLVPIGERQIAMTMAQRAAMLRGCTRRFSEDEIAEKFSRAGGGAVKSQGNGKVNGKANGKANGNGKAK